MDFKGEFHEAHDREGHGNDSDGHPQIEDDQGLMGKIKKIIGALVLYQKRKKIVEKEGMEVGRW